MKNITLWLRVLLVPLDMAAIALAITIAYNARAAAPEDIGILGLSGKGLVLPLSTYLGLFALSIPIWLFFFFKGRLYDLKSRSGLLDKLGRIVLYVSSAYTFSLALLFLTKTVDLSRIVIINSWWISIIVLFLLRVLARLIEKYLWSLGVDVRRVAFLGANGAARELEAVIANIKDHSWRVVGIIDDKDVEGRIGKVADLPELLGKHRFDELWIMDVNSHKQTIQEAVTNCQLYGVTVRLLPHNADLFLGQLTIEEFYGRPMLRVKRTPLEGWNKVLKRFLDFLFAAILLIVLSPIMGIIALLIKLGSADPAIFKQRRVGESGQFTFYKFRTMRQGADKQHDQLIAKHGNMFKLKDDPRVTRIGRILRRTSLDELPQLINVLKGEMSLVGPRPPLPMEVERYSLQEKRRLGIRPGMTGLWQVSGRSDLSFEAWVVLDAYYIENWSLWLDIKIVLKTVWVLLVAAKGAY